MSVWECEYHTGAPVFIEGIPYCSPKCNTCGIDMTESISDRNTGDFITCLFVDCAALNMHQYGKKYQATEVRCTGSLFFIISFLNRLLFKKKTVLFERATKFILTKISANLNIFYPFLLSLLLFRLKVV